MIGHRRALPHATPPARVTRKGLRDAARLFAYILPFRSKLIVALACMLVASLTSLAFPYLAGRLIDSAAHGLGREAASGLVTGRGIDRTGVLLLFVLAIQGVCTFAQSYWLAEVGEHSVASLRRDVYSRLLRLPLAFFVQRRVGELASRITADLSQIQASLTGAVPQLLGQSVMLAGGLTLIALTSVKLTLVMLSSVPVVIGLTVAFGKFIHKLSSEIQDRLADTNVVVEETLHGIATVKAFTNEPLETSRYQAGTARLTETTLRGARYQAAFGAFVLLGGFGSMVLVIWYGIRLVEARELTIGDVTRFMLYTMFMGGAIGGLARLYGDLQRVLGVTQRVRELLQEAPEELGDKPLDGQEPFGSAMVAPARISGDLAFQSVVFAYPSRKNVAVLRNLSLAAKPGQRIALVGPSGAGKSTIIALLQRFYDPDFGRVLIDGQDSRNYRLHDLRGQMALVPQDVLLFGGTIAENIAYGRPGATLAEIEDAARKGNAHAFITSFPDGYQTFVGERGITLSTGQRQRIAIARAVLRNPAILILDEATSSLDSESEHLVQQALDELMNGRTSVIVAHRLSTVRRADCIYVIKDGETVEAGTHEQLLAQPGGLYRNFLELQLGPITPPRSI